MWIQYNANRENKRTTDCTVRAISKLMEQSWDDTYIGICIEGLIKADMPDVNRVWGNYLRRNGYKRYTLPNTCPDCYTVDEFCTDHPEGKYLLALEGHVVACENGNFYDTWDSSGETVVYYWTNKEE